MTEIAQQMEKLVDAVRQSKYYTEMTEAWKEIKEQPGLAEDINEFRRRRFALQSGLGENTPEQHEQLELFREEKLIHPLAMRFLEAELEYCRMVRALARDFYDGMQLELEFLEDLAK